MYTIHKMLSNGTTGEMLTSGQTRDQVIRALKDVGLEDYSQKWEHTLPRFGRVLIISRPIADPRGNYVIRNQ